MKTDYILYNAQKEIEIKREEKFRQEKSKIISRNIQEQGKLLEIEGKTGNISMKKCI